MIPHENTAAYLNNMQVSIFCLSLHRPLKMRNPKTQIHHWVILHKFESSCMESFEKMNAPTKTLLSNVLPTAVAKDLPH